jgi:hypothetical protein
MRSLYSASFRAASITASEGRRLLWLGASTPMMSASSGGSKMGARDRASAISCVFPGTHDVEAVLGELLPVTEDPRVFHVAEALLEHGNQRLVIGDHREDGPPIR